MSKKEFYAIAVRLKGYYPDSKLFEADDTIQLWHDRLKHYDPEVLKSVVDEWAENSKWPPTIADLIESADKKLDMIILEDIEKMYLKR